MMKTLTALCLIALCLGAEHSLVYVTSSVDQDSEGIILYDLDLDTGKLTYVSGTKGLQHPSYLNFDHKLKHLYSTTEEDKIVYAHSIDQTTGSLTYLNQQPGHGGPVYVFVDYTDQVVLVANYNEGNVVSFPIEEDGSLGSAASIIQHHGSSVNPDRQAGPHAHFVTMDPTNRYAISVDLGTDQVLNCYLDPETAKLTPTNPPAAYNAVPGAGPRHLVFHPNGKFVYIIHELFNIMVAASYDSESGQFTVLQTISTLPAGATGENYAAAVNILPNGKFLYGSNRGINNIVVYSIDQNTGILTEVQFISVDGDSPRDFTIDPTGRILLVANEKSNNVVTFLIDSESGQLTESGHQVSVTTPQCVKAIPSFDTRNITL